MDFKMENPTLNNAASIENGNQNQDDYQMENNCLNNNGMNNDYKQDSSLLENGAGNNNDHNDIDNNDIQHHNGDNTLSQDYSENNESHNENGNDENGEPQPNNKRQASDFDASNNSNNNNYQKRQKTGMNSQSGNRNYGRKDGQVDLRILLPSKDAGAIIGRGGANIKKLRQEHKTQIQVPDCNGPERLLLISGDIDTCINALLDVIPLLEENQKFNNNEGAATELRLLVHQSQAGCIIGRGGDKIKDLRIKHNLDMKVYSECAPMSTERVCQMKGKSPDIVNCLREAIGLLESAPPKGMSRPYDPHNFDEFLSSQYGGFCNDKRGGGNMQGGRGGFNNNNNGNNRGGYNNNNNRGGYNRNNDNGYNNNNNGMSRGNDRGNRGGMSNRGNDRGRNMNNDRNNRGNMNNNDRNGGRNSMGGGFNNRGGNDRGGRGGYNNSNSNNNSRGGYNNNGNNGQQNYSNSNSNNQNNNSNQPGSQTNQVTIPNELAGAVIGPKGAKIQQIRDQSGAGITIDKPTPGSNDRIITIQGTAEQIQNAQYLLQVTVKQSGLWQGP